MCHVTRYVTPIVDIRGLAERRVRATRVMMVPTKHDWPNLALADSLVKLECDVDSAHGISIQDSCLRAHNEGMLLGITNPDVVVTVLSPTGRVNIFHCNPIGLNQVAMVFAQADPSEWPIAIIEANWSHYILYV